MKQGQVVVSPAPGLLWTTTARRLRQATTMRRLWDEVRPRPRTRYVVCCSPRPLPDRYDTCSALKYPEPTEKPIAWNRLTIGSMLCVRATHLETTKSLITVVDRSGRSATLRIITWND